ncbi:hypothetical protein K439DRAFT_1643775 [Ramaria rubella]|nr:hypothetical protein K439DRAFT_1643775 [Ramaria rubella]
MLTEVLDLPDPLIMAHRYRASALECIALLCAWLRSPEDQWGLATKYACPQSAISEITNETARYINDHWSHFLDWDNTGVVHPSRLHAYATALAEFGAPMTTVFGFINCTIHPTCRPGGFQELVYTGYKKCHGMKFQGVVTPNGLMAHLCGPFHAPQNNVGVLGESRLLEMLEEKALQPGSQDGDLAHKQYFHVYGDSAYGVSPVMLSPFSGVGKRTLDEAAFNMAMGAVHISVEHSFGIILQDWPFINCFWKHRIWGTQCGTLFRVAVLLTNAHSCLVPNQTSQWYDCMPPSLAEYFHG